MLSPWGSIMCVRTHKNTEKIDNLSIYLFIYLTPHKTCNVTNIVCKWDKANENRMKWGGFTVHHKAESTNISIVVWVAYSDKLCLEIKSWSMSDMTTNENEMEGEWACPCINPKSSSVWSVQKIVPNVQKCCWKKVILWWIILQWMFSRRCENLSRVS